MGGRRRLSRTEARPRLPGRRGHLWTDGEAWPEVS
ncbi:hypothetical protein STVIR_6537 [Streptomyces viridochromogenes Tue57]|uniref:Uncharacterized protein n=1 Tax=Streptomyces viridochromogenes Tue57 TaxID=1160705 RepID=L8P4T2_STRVR|nr:hypothetical protein STVIR_6537 [Streptomyces viridochromogenes Tue57]